MHNDALQPKVEGRREAGHGSGMRGGGESAPKANAGSGAELFRPTNVAEFVRLISAFQTRRAYTLAKGAQAPMPARELDLTGSSQALVTLF